MRCYNGCPDKALQAVLDHRAAVMKEAHDNGLRLTWFPAEEKWMAFGLEDHLARSGFHDHPEQAMAEAKEPVS